MSQNDFKTQQLDVAQSTRVISQRVESMYSLYSAALRESERLARVVRAKEEIIRNYDAEWNRRGSEPPIAYSTTATQYMDRIGFLEAELKKFKDYGRLKDLAKLKVERSRDALQQELNTMLDYKVEWQATKAENQRLREMNTTQAEAYKDLERRAVANQSVAAQIRDNLINENLIAALREQLKSAHKDFEGERKLRIESENTARQLSDELATIRDAVKHPSLYSRSKW